MQHVHVKLNAGLSRKKISNQQEEDFFHQQTGLKKEISKAVYFEHSFVWCCKLDTSKRRSEMWCWRRTKKISWIDRVRNEEVLHRVKEKRNILHTVERRKVNWIDHSLRRNCLLKQILKER